MSGPAGADAPAGAAPRARPDSDTSAFVGLFNVVDDGVPDATGRALEGACAARSVPYFELHAATVQSWNVEPLPEGSALYAAATSARAMAIEDRLWGPGVGTVYVGRRGPLKQVHASTAAFLAAGVPTPRTLIANSADAAALRAAADTLGGFPIVLRFPGYSGGRGIVRVDTHEGLVSALEHAAARGARPELVAYVDDAESWRVVVIDGRAVGATRGAIPDGDFRSRESDEAGDYVEQVPVELAAPAVAACSAVDTLAAGVDLLRTADGRVVVLEANTPFFFAHLQERGIDVAGALVDALIADAARRTQSR